MLGPIMQAGNKSLERISSIRAHPCTKENHEKGRSPPALVTKSQHWLCFRALLPPKPHFQSPNAGLACALVICVVLQFTSLLHPVNFSFKILSKFLPSPFFQSLLQIYCRISLHLHVPQSTNWTTTPNCLSYPCSWTGSGISSLCLRKRNLNIENSSGVW